MKTEVRVSSSVTWIGVGGIVFALGCAIGAWASGESGGAPWFAAFSLPGIYLLAVGRTRLAVDDETVEVRTLLNTYRMPVREIQRVETDREMNGLVLHGPGKQLVIYGPAWYSARGRAAVFDRLLNSLQVRCVPIQVTRWSLLARMRNTRVARGKRPHTSTA